MSLNEQYHAAHRQRDELRRGDDAHLARRREEKRGKVNELLRAREDFQKEMTHRATLREAAQRVCDNHNKYTEKYCYVRVDDLRALREALNDA